MGRKPLFPGMKVMTVQETLIFARSLKEDHNASEITEILTTIDDCLSIQKSGSLIDRFSGKRKYNSKKYKDIIYERAASVKVDFKSEKA